MYSLLYGKAQQKGEKMSLYNKKRMFIFRIIRNIMGVLFILSVAVAVVVLIHYRQMRLHNESIRELVTIMPSEMDSTKKKFYGSQNNNENSRLPVVDFEALKELNESCVGWIYACDGAISYPVVAAVDDYYLNHAVDGIKSDAGAIFVNAKDENPFAGSRAVLYGHNMKDGSMFHPLMQYWQEDGYLLQHPYVYIITEEETYQYEITSVYVTEYEKLAFETFQEQNSQAVIDLVTCEYSGKNTRLVVEARRDSKK